MLVLGPPLVAFVVILLLLFVFWAAASDKAAVAFRLSWLSFNSLTRVFAWAAQNKNKITTCFVSRWVVRLCQSPKFRLLSSSAAFSFVLSILLSLSFTHSFVCCLCVCYVDFIIFNRTQFKFVKHRTRSFSASHFTHAHAMLPNFIRRLVSLFCAVQIFLCDYKRIHMYIVCTSRHRFF